MMQFDEMRTRAATAAILLLAACGGEQAEAPNQAAAETSAPSNVAAAPQPSPAPTRPTAGTEWRLDASGADTTLSIVSAGGRDAAIRIICPAKRDTLIVNVPAFRPIASEERLSFGSGGSVAALVADVRGDRQRGGVTAMGAVKGELAALLGGPVSASYGAQSSGPHAAPPPDMARSFIAACGTGAAAPAVPSGPAPKQTAAGAAGPCLTQDGSRIEVAPRRAIGTEPFWGARIEGRCVTYSHPEDQAGTRIWTRYAKNGDGESWTGALGGLRFALRIRSAPGCSDGMSDRRYPFTAELEVAGERRSGCAERA